MTGVWTRRAAVVTGREQRYSLPHYTQSPVTGLHSPRTQCLAPSPLCLTPGQLHPQIIHPEASVHIPLPQPTCTTTSHPGSLTKTKPRVSPLLKP